MKQVERLSEKHQAKHDELMRVMDIAVKKAQQESRDMGVANYYSIDGVPHWELPDGTLTTECPWPETE